MDDDKILTYKRKDVDVDWDGRICIHMGECGFAKCDLFVGGRDPWCKSDLSSVEEIIDIVKRCPTVAKVFKVKMEAWESKLIRKIPLWWLITDPNLHGVKLN